MTEFEAPAWFCEMFGRTSLDWVRDLERLDNATIVPGEIHPSLQQRADQLWLAVVAHQPSSSASATVVDSAQPVHPYEPASERPRLGFPEPAIPSTPPRSDALRNYAPGMFVTREATVNVAPKVDCPECRGNGTLQHFDGQEYYPVPCRDCDGSGLVAAPPSVPRETGAAPEDSELLRPLTDAERAVIEAEQTPADVVAAQVAAAQAGLDRMRNPR